MYFSQVTKVVQYRSYYLSKINRAMRILVVILGAIIIIMGALFFVLEPAPKPPTNEAETDQNDSVEIEPKAALEINL